LTASRGRLRTADRRSRICNRESCEAYDESFYESYPLRYLAYMESASRCVRPNYAPTSVEFVLCWIMDTQATSFRKFLPATTNGSACLEYGDDQYVVNTIRLGVFVRPVLGSSGHWQLPGAGTLSWSDQYATSKKGHENHNSWYGDGTAYHGSDVEENL